MRRLKDERLQRLLDEISDGDFSKQLNEHLQNICGRTGMTDADYRVYFGSLPGEREMVNRFSVLFFAHEIEEIKDFDPNGWNCLPVEPPVGVWLRVEFNDREKCVVMFNGHDWETSSGKIVNPRHVARFALWEFPEKQEDAA